MDMRRPPRLVRLGDSSLALSDPAQDIRGRKAFDAHGDEIGEVDDLLVDEVERRVRFIRIATGGFLGIGATTFLVPIDAVTTVKHDTVQIDRARDQVATAPVYDPNIEEQDYLDELYGYYGYTPYWQPGYFYPSHVFYAPDAPARPGRRARHADGR